MLKLNDLLKGVAYDFTIVTVLYNHYVYYKLIHLFTYS